MQYTQQIYGRATHMRWIKIYSSDDDAAAAAVAMTTDTATDDKQTIFMLTDMHTDNNVQLPPAIQGDQIFRRFATTQLPHLHKVSKKTDTVQNLTPCVKLYASTRWPWPLTFWSQLTSVPRWTYFNCTI